MLKKSLLLATAVLLAQGAFAETLTPQAALQRASANNGSRKIAALQEQPTLVSTMKTVKGEPAVYVFNSANGGSLILSASDRAIPVLGYTDSGSFDPDNVPPQMHYWLEGYAAQIQYAEENNLQPVSKNVGYTYPTDWTYIAPLVKSQWDQGKPYNNLTPSNAPTGCVATAMAQIMNYWQYPPQGHGSVSYTLYGTNTTLSMNFDDEPFKWEDMLLNYDLQSYTPAQANAVAYLMKACGYSVHMYYSPGASGSQVERAALALVDYFGYDGNIKAIQRDQYSLTEWSAILYDQLKNVGPVLYSGHSLGNMAHAFIADGYDGNGYFHINWGWSGLCDGFYSLDALNPDVQGTGGSSYGGFNFSQGMILNIKKSDNPAPYQPEEMMTLLGNTTATNASTVLTFSFTHAAPGNLCNNSMVPITPVIGICIENESTGEKKYAEATGVYFNGRLNKIPLMTQGTYVSEEMTIKARFDSSLDNGKYKVQLVWKNGDNATEWKNFLTGAGCHDYVYVTKDGTKYSVENMPLYRIKIESAEVVSPLYMRNPCQIQFTVTNPSDTELSQSIVPLLFYNGKASFEGDSQLVTVAPHETITTTLVYTFSPLSGGTAPTINTPREYTLGAYDYAMLYDNEYGKGEYGESYYGDFGTVTMYRSSTTVTVRMRSMKIANAAESGTQQGVGFIYGINDASNMVVEANVECTSGFLSTPITAIITEFDPVNNTNSAAVYEKNFENLLYIGSGDSQQVSTVLNFDNFDPSKLYTLTLYYVQSNARQTFGYVHFGASSGVDEVIGAEMLDIAYNGCNVKVASGSAISSVVIYDMSGKVVESRNSGNAGSVDINVSGLAKGIYVVRATDADNNTKTLKINK